MLTDRFVNQTTLTPQRIAVGHCGAQLSYEVLLQRANAFARFLAQHGIGANQRVALTLPKGIDALVAYVGTLLASATSVPIDSRLPPLRLCKILEDCAPIALVSSCATLDRLHQQDPHLIRSLALVVTNAQCCLEAACLHDFNERASAYPIQTHRSEELPAYVLYTSGTTGDPKGVVHSHASAVAFVDWAIRTFGIGPSARLSNCAQWSFDLSVLDLWTTLSTGARVDLVAPELLLRPQELVHQLRTWRTTHFYAVPSTISLLESDGKLKQQPLPDLGHVLYAGEAFSVRRLRAVMEHLPQAVFHNLFGPTETNVCVYHTLLCPPELDDAQIPIGRACDHLTVELLDETAQSVSTEAEGEVCVSGPSVMSEYFRRPVDTQLAFFNSSHFADGRARYRTGDYATCDASGLLWFRGRRDRMVKRRGYRVELGELEAAVSISSAVLEAAAYALGAGEHTEIHLAVALKLGAHQTSLELKILCGKVLPSYMLPDSILIHDRLPRTPNGKVDLQRLADSSGVRAKINA